MKLKALIKLTRIEHGFMLSFAVLLTYFILGVDLSQLKPEVLLSSLLVPLFIEIGSFSLNDYLDYKADKLNKRTDRPLVNGEISKNTALLVFSLSYILAVFFSLFLPKASLYMALAFAFLSIAYDFYLKHLPLLGNLVIALSMGIPFIFANSIISNDFDVLSLILFSMAFFLGLAREIIKDIEDYEGEKSLNSSTLPIVIGIRNSSIIASLFMLVFIAVSIIPFIYYLEPSFFSVVLLMTAYLFSFYSLGIMLFSIKDNDYKQHARKVKKYTLYSMFFGLLSLLLASLSL